MRIPLKSIFSTCALLLLVGPAPLGAADVPQERPVVDIRLLAKDVGRVDWSPQGDRLAYDKLLPDGRYHLYTATPETLVERCLTCLPLDLRKKNNLNPTWHPSGEYLVFQVQSSARKLALDPVALATANRGLFSELWMIRRDGKDFWQLTRVNEFGGAILDPHFSFEGDQILWSERVRSRVGRWGTWVLRVAELETRRGVPRLGKPRTFEPGPQKLFYSGSSFLPDDRGALVFGNQEPGQLENGMDIYTLDFESGVTTRLTHSRHAWDEQAQYSPRGDKIVWISASEIDLRTLEETKGLPPEQLRDLWIMNPDGSDKARLTYFNHPGSRESIGAAIIDDFSWNPRGDQIAAHVIYSSFGEIQQALYLIQLDESFRR